jgi:hypothetical protein
MEFKKLKFHLDVPEGHHQATMHVSKQNSSILYLWLYSPLDLGRFFSFIILYTVGSAPWTGDQPLVRPLPTHRTIQTQNECKQTSMPREGFEPKTPVFERAKAVHALDRAATAINNDTVQCFDFHNLVI